ncbi:H(+)-exporting diphosphatase [Forsythia ovata]|uniref:H(+)-exporting diphosphatase n=1 Tax=Forsythia ovata TaxID=205694 RepID=A0ABD1X1V3_9LAMI
MGIHVCLITTLFATDFFEITAVKEIELALKRQLIISTVLMTVGTTIFTWTSLPLSFTIYNFGTQKVGKNEHKVKSTSPLVQLWLDKWTSGFYFMLVQPKLDNWTSGEHKLPTSGEEITPE